MASQTLQTILAINAQANGFGQVGATLTELGTIVDGLSQKLIQFGMESAEVYKDYEKSMHEAEVALSTSYGRNTQELADAMDQLHAKATEWAATTIFHTDDVANAINQAAHAGWDLDQILNGLPVAMQLAQAGSMDLSTSLEYITKTMAAYGVPYEGLQEFVDMWVFAANSSTGDVKDFGDAMKKLGATMRFTESKEELFALIGLMHDMGESGSTAATLLRTSMMRLIAPSGVTHAVLKQLGATDEEIKAIREDASKVEAFDILSKHGFSAFDDKGQAKGMLEIYEDLGEALADIAGGWDKINKNETTLGILGNVFGTKGITGALDIITAYQSAKELRDKLLNGEANDYGLYAQGTMMDTLYGKEEIFESKIERLKQVVGEELAGQLEGAMESIGNIVDKIAEMDDGKFSALVRGLEIIAAAGPGLLAAGTLFRLIGTVLTPAGGIGLGLIALTAAAKAIKELQEYDFSQNFGNMKLDTTDINNYVKSIGEDFRVAYENTDHFAKALETAKENYQTASETFSANIFSMMLQNTKLTPEDVDGLLKLGDEMYGAVSAAIYSAASQSGEYWTALFGGEEEALKNPTYQKIIELTNKEYTENQAQLEGIGKQMRQTIIDAFTGDDELDETDYNKILEVMRKYNDMMARAAAEAAAEENYIKQNRWLEMAQTASLEDIEEISRTVEEERAQILQEQEKRYSDNIGRLKYRGADQEMLDETERLFKQEQLKTTAAYDDFLFNLWVPQTQNGAQRDNYAQLQKYATLYNAGKLSADVINVLLNRDMGSSAYAGGYGTDSDRAQLGRIMGMMMLSLGGYEDVAERIDYYEKNGDKKSAERLRQIYTMDQLINNFGQAQKKQDWGLLEFLNFLPEFSTSNQTDDYGLAHDIGRRDFESKFGTGDSQTLNLGEAKSLINLLSESSDSLSGFMQTLRKSMLGETGYGGTTVSTQLGMLDEASRMVWDSIFESLSSAYDLEAVAKGKGWFADGLLRDYYAAWDLLYGEASKNPEQFKLPITPVVEEGADIEPIQAPVEPILEETELQNQGKLELNTDDYMEELGKAKGSTDNFIYEDHLIVLDLNHEAVDGYVPPEFETTLTITPVLSGGIGGIGGAEGIGGGKSVGGKGLTGSIGGLFSEGGRATVASIFGEGDTAEWAIPEEHSNRTAELINAAREASGFTWNELLGRYGGLNANPQNKPTTLVYSPTINAADASGVEQVLKDDKKRLERWFEDKQMHDAAEVYS